MFLPHEVTHKNQTFENVNVDLDGHSYDGCTFRNCQLVYRGGEPPTIINCSFYGVTFGFDDAAGRTVNFMSLLFHGGFRHVIDATFNNIRHGTVPNQPGGFGTIH